MIYYIGRYIPDGSLLVECLAEDHDHWSTGCLTDSAAIYNYQPIASQKSPDPLGLIAVSPDGNTIAYVGATQASFRPPAPPTSSICYYSNIDDWNFTYHEMPGFIVFGINTINFLQFKTSSDLYLASATEGWAKHHFKYQQPIVKIR